MQADYTTINLPPTVATTTLVTARKMKEVQLNPALLDVCSCESTGSIGNSPRQFNADGSVLRGKINPHDIGECQINETYNGATATKLGYDIYTKQGNIEMANYMYKHSGLQPWSWSEGCWGKKN